MPRRILASVASCLFICATVQFASAQTTFTESVFHSFTTADGASPQNLILAQDGNFYGIAGGGAHGAGVIYKVTPAGVGSTFFTFTGSTQVSVSTGASLIQGRDGNFYGSSYAGGAHSFGVIFEVTSGGTYSALYSFTGATDGEHPNGIIQGSDGNFYGTAQTGSEADGANYGTIFSVSPDGQFLLLADLTEIEGFLPESPLLEVVPGTFLGTASMGGQHNYGSVFSVTGTAVTVLYSLGVDGDTDGHYPSAGLVETPGDLLFGGTTAGGGHGDGSIYSILTSGAYTNLTALPFDASGSSGIDNALLLATDGNLYGAIAAQNGTLFQETIAGALTGLYTFGASPDGNAPVGALIQGTDGNLYGVTTNGGADAAGTIYKLAPSPAFAAPIQLTLSSTTTAVGTPVTLQWNVPEAFSSTASNCAAFIQGEATGGGNWSGNKGASGNSTINPTAAGTYTYALTCGGVESGFATLTVTASTKSASTTALGASPNPATVGESVTLTANISGSGATPTGSVTFYYGSQALSTVPLSSGKATLTAGTSTLPPGTYQLTAAYSGDSNYNASASSAYTVTLNKAATKTTLTASPNPVTSPAVCTLTATVTRSAGSGFATGTVTFSVQGTALGSAKLNGSGVATFSAPTAGIAAGSYPVVATYSGDASDTVSASTALTVKVQ
jgi:uncharacterized repeat protein (TIGR03803 family)